MASAADDLRNDLPGRQCRRASFPPPSSVAIRRMIVRRFEPEGLAHGMEAPDELSRHRRACSPLSRPGACCAPMDVRRRCAAHRAGGRRRRPDASVWPLWREGSPLVASCSLTLWTGAGSARRVWSRSLRALLALSGHPVLPAHGLDARCWRTLASASAVSCVHRTLGRASQRASSDQFWVDRPEPPPHKRSIEAPHCRGAFASGRPRRAGLQAPLQWSPGECPERQRGRTVNPLAMPSQVRVLLPPPLHLHLQPSDFVAPPWP